MLDVDGGPDVDAVVEDLLDVLVTLAVFHAGHVGVGHLVHQQQLRMSVDDGLGVHVLEALAAVFDQAPGYHRQVAQHEGGVFPPVGLDVTHLDIYARTQLLQPFREHGVGLAHPMGRAEKYGEAALPSLVTRPSP